MVLWCGTCARYIDQTHAVEGKTCCSLCGKVLFEDTLSEQAGFVKGAGGESKMAGNFVRTIQSEISLSRVRTLREAEYGIQDMVAALDIDGGDSIVRPALAFYTIAVERNFTRGRRKEQVEAACLYLACRDKEKPYLLIDFSEHLRINVYALGAVFLMLCKLLSLEEHPIVQKPVDPSLFIHRFSDRLCGRKPIITRTALQIVASMKRDWMQTGRKPSGLCGAALYISALSHGHHCTKSDIIRIVHICEATLTKRLIEFENTESGGMTIEEFKNKEEELERELPSKIAGAQGLGSGKLLCSHDTEPPFAYGLCELCYEEFVRLSGGLDGGSEPPAFQRAEIERMKAKEAERENADLVNSSLLHDTSRNDSMLLNKEGSFKSSTDGADMRRTETDANGEAGEDVVESDTLSDIDDAEVEFYLHNEEEKKLKKTVWEEMNKEYLEEQAAKEAAALAAQKAYEEELSSLPESVIAARESVAAATAKLRKERQLRRASEAKNVGPASTAAEAAKQTLDRKRLSKKVRFDLLEKLFDETDPPTKKTRTDSDMADDFSLDAGHVYNNDADTGVGNEEFDLANAGTSVEDDAGYDSDFLL